MSWSEIMAISEELQAVKNIIEKSTGLKIVGTKVVDPEKEMDELRDALKELRKTLKEKEEKEEKEEKRRPDLNNIVNEFRKLKERIDQMSLNLDALTAEVERARTVQSSAVTLLHKLAGELEVISKKLDETAAQVPPVFDTAPLNELIDKLKTSTDGLAAAVADSSGVTPMTEVVLNADDPTKPTVEVVMPEVLPENVVITAEQVVDVVDPTSPEPQVVVTVEAAPAPVEDAPAPAEPVLTETISTDKGEVDVQAQVSEAVAEEIKADTGVDVVEAVQEAYDAAPEVVAEPAPPVEVILNANDPTTPTVAVVMPEVLPENVVVSAETVVDTVDPASPEPQVVVTVEAAPEAAPAPSEPVVTDVIATDPGQVDVTVTAPVAVVDEIKAEANVDVVEAVKEAFEAAPEVVAEEEPKA